MLYFILNFFLYAFLGWMVESVIESIKRRRFINKGLLNGPILIVPGLSFVLGIYFLEPAENRMIIFAVGMCIICGVTEFVLGIACDNLLHARPWNYAKSRFNIMGYTCLTSVVLRGAFSAVSIKLIHPHVAILLNRIPFAVKVCALCLMTVLLILDLALTITGLRKIVEEDRKSASFTGEVTKWGEQIVKTASLIYDRSIGSQKIKWYKRHLVKNQMPITRTQTAEQDQKIFAKGLSTYKVFWIFIIGALIGDIVETVFTLVTKHTLMSRSSLLYGPFSIVWGLGGAVLTIVLYGWRDKSDRYIFFGGLLIGGVYEYACSVFTEYCFGMVFWDYSQIAFNINGRINLLYCAFWGVLALLWVKEIYPRLSMLIEKIPLHVGKIITWSLSVLLIVDVLLSAAALYRMDTRSKGVEAGNVIEVFLDQTYPDEYLVDRYQNLIPVE